VFVRLPGPLTTSFAVAGICTGAYFFATRLRANGVHEWDIRDLLGHASVRMTSVYTHQTPTNLCKAVNTLGQTKLGKVVRFQKKKGDSSTNQIAPSSRHCEIDPLSDQHHESVNVRTLAS